VHVGPDNGVLAPAVAMLGGAQTVVALTDPDYQLDAPGPTFAGRDVMAPAAAHLANGVPITDLGDVVDPASLVPGLLPLPSEEEGDLVGEVLWVDRFGNCQTNLDPDMLSLRGVDPGDAIELRFGDDGRRARWVRTFADAKPSEVVVLVDSYGLLAIALDRRSAAQELKLRPGTRVTVATAPPSGEAR
jgi:S-adenosylmethionine hydrolase